MPPGLPYARLSGFYFFWFATLGALLPYWGLYMQHWGYSAVHIGGIFGVLLAGKIVAPILWGWLADRLGRRLPIIRLATLAALAAFVWVPWAPNFLWLALILAVYGFFSNASLPQFEAVTFNHLGEKEQFYGRIRLWGSVGFIASVTILGLVTDLVSIRVVPYWMMAALLGICAVSFMVPETRAPVETVSTRGLLGTLGQPEVMSLLAVCFLSQLSHSPYYVFFSIFMEDHGYTRTAIGGLWSIGVLAEIVVFLLLPLLLPNIGPRRLMLTALGLTTLRWLLLAALPENLTVILLVQFLHLASFGLYHAVAVYLIHQFFRGRLQGRGQALYSSLSFGAGGALGSLAAGWLWELSPGAPVYLCAAAVALLAFAIAWLGLKPSSG